MKAQIKPFIHPFNNYINKKIIGMHGIGQTRTQLQEVQFLRHQHFVENNINQFWNVVVLWLVTAVFIKDGVLRVTTSITSYEVLHSCDQWAKRRRFDCTLLIEK